MKTTPAIAMLIGMLLPPAGGAAPADGGGAHELTLRYETASRTDDRASGTSNGHETIVERLIGTDPAGDELVYDLPRSATAADRARSWQFPARVRRAPDGAMTLLNTADLEARLGAWLKAAGLDRRACGRVVFTWNVFKIECAPDSVLGTIARFALPSLPLQAGQSFSDGAALGTGRLERTAAGFTVSLPVDPAFVRAEMAASDVVVGEVTGAPVSREAANRRSASVAVSGTITTTFDTDAGGKAWRRTNVTDLTIVDGASTRTSTSRETVTRTRVDQGEVLSRSPGRADRRRPAAAR